MKCHYKKRSICIFDALLIFVILTSLSSILLLVLNRFNSVNAIIFASILLTLFLKGFNLSLKWNDGRFDFGIIIILLIAVFFRIEPDLHIIGGRDAGLYVIMSSKLERSGSTFIVDDLRKHLNSNQKEVYDKNTNIIWKDLPPNLKGRYEGSHLPGIYIKDIDNSEYVFQINAWNIQESKKELIKMSEIQKRNIKLIKGHMEFGNCVCTFMIRFNFKVT